MSDKSLLYPSKSDPTFLMRPKSISRNVENLVIPNQLSLPPSGKPGFKNRRDQSTYLKHSFPAGFQLKLAVNEDFNPRKTPKYEINDASTHPDKFSYHSWAKGGSLEEPSEYSNENGDPYADVAGPMLTEMRRNRDYLKDKVSSQLFENDPSCFVTKCKISIPSKNDLNRSIASLSLSSSANTHIFHAPSALPSLPGGNSSSTRVYQTMRSPQYDRWLEDRRNNTADEIWRKRGNDSSFNYSSANVKIDYNNTMPVSLPANNLPKAIPNEIAVEIFTLNQIMKARSSVETANNSYFKYIFSETKLSEFKSLIAYDIVDSLRTFFPPLESSASVNLESIGSIKEDQVDFHMYYYCFLLETWKPLIQESDWIIAKHQANDIENNLQIMYKLEARAEELLMQQIQKQYELRKAALEKENPHISIKAITDALEKGKSLKAKKKFDPYASMISFNDSLSRSIYQSTMMPSAQSPVPASPTKTLINMEKSILYPKKSIKLEKLQDDNQLALLRFEAYANNLEQKLLKTKW